jgi:hypothetical protein
LLFFASIQLILAVLMEHHFLVLRDPEYAVRLQHLKDRLMEGPRKPRVVALGSSRIALGFRPDRIEIWPGCQEPPLVFNFGALGSGPVRQLCYLRRLLDDSIHPDWLIVEVLPTHLHQWPQWREENFLDPSQLSWRDLTIWRRFHSDPKDLYCRWAAGRLTSCFTCRFSVMHEFATAWLPRHVGGVHWQTATDRLGWTPCTVPADAAMRSRIQESIRKQYAPAFHDFEISDLPNRAMHETLDLCRRERIAVLLLLMPESSEFRNWYSDVARTRIDTYVADLSQEYGLPVIDARTWISDIGFLDGHHLLHDFATLFTERLGREVLKTVKIKRVVAAPE